MYLLQTRIQREYDNITTSQQRLPLIERLIEWSDIVLKKLFIGTNIVLDVLQNREPNVVHSARVLQLAREGRVALYATSECISTSWYVLARGGNKAEARQHLRVLIEIIRIVPVSHRAVALALSSDFSDIEDAILHYTALELGDIDAIVTGNLRDFKNSVLPVLHPSKVVV